MKAAIVYTSITGNTKELAGDLYQICLSKSVDTTIYKIEEFPISRLTEFQAFAIGSYTWGNGEIPKEMLKLYRGFQAQNRKDITTAVFGTGDSFYPNFCGAVDLFRDMLYVHTNLAATLKVELLPQKQDFLRCQKFVELLTRELV
ncbi:flavodoxin [Bacillus sp. M6-12]|uniref:flavodoxin domain-containing protein n=1 Tax=Bacillus sp. M6-12 TaxID=2054166 RepID=UPI000C78B96B|nr:flavodoxin domain-containing protein [Bacillus sp. M6-12]PLS18218.1 flavodoxin [Bacillus sp. M6-12]